MKPIMLILFLSYALVSCEKDSPFEQFEGEWEGSYLGEDTGNWNATIDSEGRFTGTAVSDSLPNFPFHLNGQVNENGMFIAHSNVLIGTIEFNGQLSNGEATGTWVNLEAGLEGTWSGERQ